MPGGGAKPGERRGGRKKNSLNKATIAKLRDAQVAEKVAEIINAPPQAGATLQHYPARTRAKDELSEMIPVVKSHVGQFQQAAIASGMPGDPKFNPSLWKMYKDWWDLYVKVCDTAADFQDPRLKAQLWVAPPADIAPPRQDDDRRVVRMADPVRASRLYQQAMQAPRQKALPPPAKRSA